MSACQHPADRREPLFPARDYITGETFEVARCAACGLVRTTPPPEQPGRYYPDAYYGAAGARRFPVPVEALQRLMYAQRARAVERLAGRPGVVLDIGCGRGHLLAAFRRRGWEVQGTELDDRSAAHAREVVGVPVHVGAWEGWPWADAHFDAVTVWHVLEHLAEPEEALARIARLVRPGGVVMVGVPNFASPEARATKAGWFHLDVPRHACHLTPEWLSSAFARQGLEVRRRSFATPEFDAFSLVQSAENAFGLPQNLLYDVLRGHAAKLLGGSARPLEIAAALGLAAPLGLVALPATAALALARAGSSVTVFAVRRA
ncbi:MAG TPA: class I SAM-dependent methyltransferase [Anaeromyxobacter sp.]|jgi:SAM-dependent methyltransferase|nr:class I SAM-dependent methyltransferase [Anaeromyxobacter sp.]